MRRRVALALLVTLLVAACDGAAQGENSCDAESQPEDAPEVVRLYSSVWNEPDTAERLAILERIWAENASFVDPLLDERVTGIDEFNGYLDGFTEAYAGYYFTLQAWTAGDHHHNQLRMRWNFCDPGGALLVEGTDFGVLDANGRLQSIASFYALPWPEPPTP